MENETNKPTIKQFLKENMYLLILAGVVLLLSIIVIIASAVGTKTKPIDNKPPVSSNTTKYYIPVANATISKEYSATELQYNATLNQWEAHKAIDFLATAGSEVRAITSGEVIDVYTNHLEGTVVKIKHANGIVSEYGSLSDDVKVKKGDNVASNAVIGYVSASATARKGLRKISRKDKRRRRKSRQSETFVYTEKRQKDYARRPRQRGQGGIFRAAHKVRRKPRDYKKSSQRDSRLVRNERRRREARQRDKEDKRTLRVRESPFCRLRLQTVRRPLQNSFRKETAYPYGILRQSVRNRNFC